MSKSLRIYSVFGKNSKLDYLVTELKLRNNAGFYCVFKVTNQLVIIRGAGVFLPGGAKFKKRTLFLLKRHCQQKQILVVMLQFEILVDMIEFRFAKDRPLSRKSFILLICYVGSINFLAKANSFL